jgi:hypothetical protein
MTHTSHHHSLAHKPGTHAAARVGVAHVAGLDPEQLKQQIIGELNIGHLLEREQNQIIDALGDVLLERATYEVMQQIPESSMAELDILAEHGSDTLLQQKIREFVPNVEQVVAAAVREGIEEHKRLVAEEVAKESDS